MFPFYEILFSVIGFLFVIMLAIIGYFLQKQITAIEKLELSTNSLDKTVSLLHFNRIKKISRNNVVFITEQSIIRYRN